MPAMIRSARHAQGVEAEGICSFELASRGRRPLPAFSAGSHVDVQLPGGLVRQYSLCNDPGERPPLPDRGAARPGLARRLGGHARPSAGRRRCCTISAPKNHFALAHEAPRAPAAGRRHRRHAAAVHGRAAGGHGAPFTLHYATRSRARTAFLERIAASPFAAACSPLRRRRAGAEARPRPVLAAPAPGTHLYVCGPKGFMDAVLAPHAPGLARGRLHWEFFGAAPWTPQVGDGGFEVQLASSGRVITVAPDQTVLQALDKPPASSSPPPASRASAAPA
jgi:vanillate monooxygenase ferredoxin subunit